MYVLFLLSLVLVAGALPAMKKSAIPVLEAIERCRVLGVDIEAYGSKDEILATTKESNNLRECFDILVSADQTALTEVAMLGVLMKRLQTRQALGEPIYELLSKGLPKGAGAKAVTNGNMSGVGQALLRRHKRQVMPLGEVGEDPGKRARKRRLGLPIGEPGEDVGKRMRQRQQGRARQNYNTWLRKYYAWYQRAQRYYARKRGARPAAAAKPAAKKTAV
ncbi:hypothetical protein LOTGIDRAFT_238831 [Lottia gigantea]|uniref:Uncharacterized protein n=1 Tax=Lottia gigantea TaxID=225164 RepID=V4AZL4_LOTGI|nr:hypothetical protein LOTGIDRAFT_238831 [Lottia gigantea]ESO99186.1 hypothetical protein LOTGIDRAFT_238831 [Lottia gigantea]